MSTKLAAIALLSLIHATSLAQQWRGFPLLTEPAADSPTSTVTGDFNGDGVADFAVSSSDSDEVLVLLGNGQSFGIAGGAFEPPVAYSVSDAPAWIEIGDFNNDGVSDLTTANYLDASFSILLGDDDGSGNGDGTFGTSASFPTGAGPLCVAVGDFNSDGIEDIATVSAFTEEIAIHFGNDDGFGAGDGTFSAGGTYTAGTSPHHIAIDDFNDDGILDIVAVNGGSSNISILLGMGSNGIGDGTFHASVEYPVGTVPFSVTTGDFNSDDVTDLVVANSDSDEISVLFGNGSGGLGDGTFTPNADYPVGDNPYKVEILDLNEDGVSDLAVANYYSHDVSILIGTSTGGVGDGMFSPAVHYSGAWSPLDIDAGDFNRDGMMDVATTNWGGDSLTFFLGSGDGGLGDGGVLKATHYPSGDSHREIVSGDFNSDGIIDFVVSSYFAPFLTVYLGNGADSVGDGSFSGPVSYPIPTNIRQLTTGDFNDDGITDFAISGNVDKFYTLLGNGMDGEGDGTFAGYVEHDLDTSQGDITAADFNGDNIQDIAISGYETFDGYLYVMLGNESAGEWDGTFAAGVPYLVGGPSRSHELGDFNEDGITDIAVSNLVAGSVSILIGNGSGGVGDGTFAPHVEYPVGRQPENIALGDFNGDTIVDIVSTNPDTDDVSLMVGNGSGGTGDGTFASAVHFDAGDSPSGITVGDFNGDSLSDIAVTLYYTHEVAVLLLNDDGNRAGDGTFSEGLRYFTSDTPQVVMSSDFNGDAMMDLVVGNVLSLDVSIFLNLGLTEPKLNLSPTMLDFGDIEVGPTPTIDSITVENSWDGDLYTTTTLTDDGSGMFALESIPPSPVERISTESFDISFTPNMLGLFTGEVTFESNDPTSPSITIALSGRGVDTLEPTSMATAPNGELTQIDPNIAVSYTASDTAGGTGLANVRLFYQFNGGGFTEYPGGPFTNSPITFDSSTTGGDGIYDFYTIATDNASNVETKAPTAEITVYFNAMVGAKEWQAYE